MTKTRNDDSKRTSPKEYPYIVGSVDRAFKLLFLLESAQQDMGVTELSRILDIQKSAVYNLLRTMLAHGIVKQTETGRYTLGLRLIKLGSTCAENLELRSVAKPILDELANETSLVVVLAAMGQDEILMLDKVEPREAFVFVPKIDHGNVFHCTSIGKLLLAYASPEVQDKLLKRELRKYTQHTNTNAEILANELKKINREGYALACDEMLEGVSCLAFPVYDSKGLVVAVVSVTAASSWLNPERYDSLSQLIKNKATEISRGLGYKA